MCSECRRRPQCNLQSMVVRQVERETQSFYINSSAFGWEVGDTSMITTLNPTAMTFHTERGVLKLKAVASQ